MNAMNAMPTTVPHALQPVPAPTPVPFSSACVVVVAVLALLGGACPGTPDIDSVDGLAGGALTSGLTVPALTVEQGITADAVTTSTLTATAATLTNVQSEGITADSATLQSLVVTEQVASLDVAALDATDLTAERASLTNVEATTLSLARGGGRLRSVLGVPVGTTAFGGGACAATGSWSEADCSCSAAFASPAAHVCTAEELTTFAESQPQDLPADLEGASFNSFTAHVGPTVTMPAPDDSVRTTWVDNCGFWSSFSVEEGPTFSFRDATMAAARNVIHVVADAGGGLKALQSDISTDCRRSAVRLACCR